MSLSVEERGPPAARTADRGARVAGRVSRRVGIRDCQSSHPWLAVAHAAGIVVAIWGCVDRRPVARTVGDLLPLFVALMLYGEVPLLIGALGSSYHDVRVQSLGVGDIRPTPVARPCDIYAEPGLERAAPHGLPGVLPGYLRSSAAFVMRAASGAGTRKTVPALTVAYVACWVIFAVAPVEGPRYLWTPNVPDGPARRLAVADFGGGVVARCRVPVVAHGRSASCKRFWHSDGSRKWARSSLWYRCSSGLGRCTAGSTTESTSLPARFWVSWSDALLWRGHRDDSNTFSTRMGRIERVGRILTNEMTVASRPGRDRMNCAESFFVFGSRRSGRFRCVPSGRSKEERSPSSLVTAASPHEELITRQMP